MSNPTTMGELRFRAQLLNALSEIAGAIRENTRAVRENTGLLREIAGQLKDRSPEPVHPGEPDIPIPRGPLTNHLPPGKSVPGR